MVTNPETSSRLQTVQTSVAAVNAAVRPPHQNGQYGTVVQWTLRAKTWLHQRHWKRTARANPIMTGGLMKVAYAGGRPPPRRHYADATAVTRAAASIYLLYPSSVGERRGARGHPSLPWPTPHRYATILIARRDEKVGGAAFIFIFSGWFGGCGSVASSVPCNAHALPPPSRPYACSPPSSPSDTTVVRECHAFASSSSRNLHSRVFILFHLFALLFHRPSVVGYATPYRECAVFFLPYILS